MKQKHRISSKRIRKCDYTDAEITAIIDGFVENNEILSSTLKNDVTKKNKDDTTDGQCGWRTQSISDKRER